MFVLDNCWHSLGLRFYRELRMKLPASGSSVSESALRIFLIACLPSPVSWSVLLYLRFSLVFVSWVFACSVPAGLPEPTGLFWLMISCFFLEWNILTLYLCITPLLQIGPYSPALIFMDWDDDDVSSPWGMNPDDTRTNFYSFRNEKTGFLQQCPISASRLY